MELRILLAALAAALCSVAALSHGNSSVAGSTLSNSPFLYLFYELILARNGVPWLKESPQQRALCVNFLLLLHVRLS